MTIIRPTTLLSLWLACNPVAGAEYVYEYEDEEASELASLIPVVTSFHREMKQSSKPMMVEFSTPWCAYCEALEAQVLEPLIRSNKYSDAIIIRKLEVDTYSDVIGFDGARYTTADISRKYDVDLYPTLVFFDASGREISERVVGITVLDYVAEEVDKAIKSAIAEVRIRSN